MDLAFHPLTAERWPDLEQLFGPRGACGGCWCMVWRLPRAIFDQQKGEGNRAALQALVAAGESPGILAYLGEAAVGWCAIAPREVYPALARSRVLRPLDAQPVWSVTCFFVARQVRGQGVSVQLLQAAVAFAAARGATLVEGYPMVPQNETMPAAFAWTGTLSAFLQAGFTEAARHSEKRPIMRSAVMHSSTAVATDTESGGHQPNKEER